MNFGIGYIAGLWLLSCLAVSGELLLFHHLF